MKKITKIKIGIFILLFIIFFGLGLLLSDDIEQITSSSVNFNVSDYSNCENLSLRKTANCLREHILPIYNYTLRESSVKNLSELVKYGGDCSDYNMLYFNMAESLGFYVEYVYIDVNRSGSYGHLITIISDENGYCLCDQTAKPKCLMYGSI